LSPRSPPRWRSTSAALADITPAEARAIAKEAYIYGLPDLWTTHASNTATSSIARTPNSRAPWNQIHNVPRVLRAGGYGDPNAQLRTTLFLCGKDLAPNPWCSPWPPIEKERYFSVQLIDAYTFNFDYNR